MLYSIVVWYKTDNFDRQVISDNGASHAKSHYIRDLCSFYVSRHLNIAQKPFYAVLLGVPEQKVIYSPVPWLVTSLRGKKMNKCSFISAVEYVVLRSSHKWDNSSRELAKLTFFLPLSRVPRYVRLAMTYCSSIIFHDGVITGTWSVQNLTWAFKPKCCILYSHITSWSSILQTPESRIPCVFFSFSFLTFCCFVLTFILTLLKLTYFSTNFWPKFRGSFLMVL